MGELIERVDEHDRVIGVVDRDLAIRSRWLHRVATAICRDETGKILVHRRPDESPRFPGLLNWLIGGAVAIGESYVDAARREVAEELGVDTNPLPLFTFRCEGAIAPYWLAVHEAVIDSAVRVETAEIAWHTWLTDIELREALIRDHFVPDSIEAHDRYTALRS